MVLQSSPTENERNVAAVVKDYKLPLSQKLVVGGFAGVIGATITFPIDIVKTRLQSQVLNAKGMMPYSGPIDCFRQIVAKDGSAGLFRGLRPTLIGIMPEKGIKLAMNDYLREKFANEQTGKLTLVQQLVSAGGAGAAQNIATNPMEITKIRMQTQQLLPVAERQTAVQVVQQLGLSGLYKGIGCTLMRDVPYALVFFPMYAELKEFAESKNDGKADILSIVASGATAGATASAIVTPADVLKTRYQMRGATFKTIAECYRHTVVNDGHSALFKGMFPRMMVQAPLFGITLLAFELQKNYMLSREQH